MMKNLLRIAAHLATNKENLPVIYIAGKVTGLPYGEVFSKFRLKQAELEADGFFVLNPLDFISETEQWQQAMRIAVVMLVVSGSICLLPDWHLSPGATLERNLALQFGIATRED